MKLFWLVLVTCSIASFITVRATVEPTTAKPNDGEACYSPAQRPNDSEACDSPAQRPNDSPTERIHLQFHRVSYPSSKQVYFQHNENFPQSFQLIDVTHFRNVSSRAQARFSKCYPRCSCTASTCESGRSGRCRYSQNSRFASIIKNRRKDECTATRKRDSPARNISPGKSDGPRLLGCSSNVRQGARCGIECQA